MEVLGYDIKILPPSGVIQTAALWMITGEIAAVQSVGSATITPEIAVADQPTHLEISVELGIPQEDIGSVQQVRADLSALGISTDLPLEHIGERRYWGSTTVTMSKRDEYNLPIEVVMGTAEGDESSYLHVRLNVYPGTDLIIHEDGPEDRWTLEVNRAESDPTSAAFVRSGNSSHAILLQPSGIFPGSVQYLFDDPVGVNVFGYTHLEFYIHGGETSGQNPAVGGKVLSDWGVTVEPDTWTLVSIPIAELPLTGGRLTSIAISGTVKETFYIDDMKLVASELPEPTAVETSEVSTTPVGYALSQNHPNPFNPETTIQYALPAESSVTLAIYNTMGQRIRTLVDGEQTAGHHRSAWDGRDDTGQAAASGLYLCRMVCGDFSAVRKLLLVR